IPPLPSNAVISYEPSCCPIVIAMKLAAIITNHYKMRQVLAIECPMGLRIYVDAYSGYKANERPRYFTVDEDVYAIAEVLDTDLTWVRWEDSEFSASHPRGVLGRGPSVLVKPFDCAGPCLWCSDFVVAFRRGVIEETMDGVWPNVDFIWNVVLLQL